MLEKKLLKVVQFGTGALGFLSGIALTEVLVAVIFPPAGFILGGASVIDGGIGEVSKAIFS